MADSKVILVGRKFVGKTCIVNRFAGNGFPSNCCATVGADYATRCVDIDRKKITLCLWDLPPLDRAIWNAMIPHYYHGVKGACLIYDITRKSSFEFMLHGIMTFELYAPADIPVMILGNKCDLEDQREVSEERGRQFAEEHGMKFMEISAKSNMNIEKALLTLAKDLMLVNNVLPWIDSPLWSTYSNLQKEEELKKNIEYLEVLKTKCQGKKNKLWGAEHYQEIITAHQHQQLAIDVDAVSACAMKEGFIEVQQLNIAVLGAGGAGKTCTLSTLVGEKPPSVYTSTDVHRTATRVASISSPSESLVRDASTGNRILLSSDNMVWLIGKQLLHLVARGANAEVKRKQDTSQIRGAQSTPVSSKIQSKQRNVRTRSSGAGSPVQSSQSRFSISSAEAVASASVIVDNSVEEIAQGVLSQATDLMKLPTSEALAKVSIINFIDSGGQLQFSEIFHTLVKHLQGGIYVNDLTKDPKSPIHDQFFIKGKPIGEPYKSQYTYELLFKRSLQALQQYEKSPRLGIVATHPDKVDPAELPDRIQQMNEWVRNLMETTEMKDKVIYNESLKDFIYTLRANNPSDDDIERARKLLQRFCDLFKDESLVTIQKIPLRQFLLEEAMKTVGEDRKGIVSIEECQRIARVIDLPLEYLENSLRNLRDCNLILYYPEVKALQDVVFCEVQTLLSIITQLVQYSAKLRGDHELADLPTLDL